VSAVVQDALRLFLGSRVKEQYSGIQRYWSTKAREKGVLSKADLKRYLED